MELESRQVRRASIRDIKKLIKNKLYSRERFDKFTFEVIEEFSNLLDWNLVSENSNLNNEFLNRFKHNINWFKLSRYHKQIPLDLVEELIEELDVVFLLENNLLPIELVDKFSTYTNYKLSRVPKDVGFIYAPYIPMVFSGGSAFAGLEDLVARELISSRYSKKTINNRYYGTVTITGTPERPKIPKKPINNKFYGTVTKRINNNKLCGKAITKKIYG